MNFRPPVENAPDCRRKSFFRSLARTLTRRKASAKIARLSKNVENGVFVMKPLGFGAECRHLNANESDSGGDFEECRPTARQLPPVDPSAGRREVTISTANMVSRFAKNVGLASIYITLSITISDWGGHDRDDTKNATRHRRRIFKARHGLRPFPRLARLSRT